MTSFTFEFEVVSADNYYKCNDWANSCRHSSLSFNELARGWKKKSETSLNVLIQYNNGI